MSDVNKDFDEEFDLMMDEALGVPPEVEDEPAKVEEKAEEEPEVEEEQEPKAEEQPEAEPAAEEPEQEEEPEPAKDKDPKVTEPKDDPKVSALEKKIAELEAKLKEPEKAEEDEPKDEKLPEEPSEDQKKVLDEVKKDWESLDKAMDVKIEMALNKVENLFADRMKQLQDNLKPYQQTTEHVARNAHEAKIFAAHPDAKDVYQDVVGWIEEQPSIVARAYQQALKEGSAEDVIEVFDNFKKAAKPETKEEPAKKEEKKPDPAKEEKLRKMEGVKSEQHAPKVEEDREDFDGAFEQALKSA